MMKELYTSPELKVLCFAPVERLAVDMDDIFPNEDPDTEVISKEGDLNLDIF